MNECQSLKPSELKDLLLQVSTVCSVFIWGPPGIGKSSVIRTFADELGMECVTLIGQQLLPEDLMGVPKIEGNVSVFCPPSNIVRDKPFVLFLDELNAASSEIQKAFMSLILDKRVGNYVLPKGTIVIAAGNRSEDSALVKTLPTPLINRMLHVQMHADPDEWLAWAQSANLHPTVINYIKQKPEHIVSAVPKVQQPFSTPRSWALLGAAMSEYKEALTEPQIKALAFGLVAGQHANTFVGFARLENNQFLLNNILDGKAKWPDKPKDRDLLYFLAQAFRSQLLKTLPAVKSEGKIKEFAYTAKGLIADLAGIAPEVAKIVLIADENGKEIPNWFALEVFRDLPLLAAKK